MDATEGEFTISNDESNEFARLSGDYNPLHIDPLFARRLQFGGSVVHGIHQMMRAWDRAFAGLGIGAGTRPAALRASFPNPARAGQTIRYTARVSEDHRAVEIEAMTGAKRVLALHLVLAGSVGASPQTPTADEPAPRTPPLDQQFPPALHAGACDLYYDRALAAGLFPTLHECYPPALLAQIVACTRVVGMECPGLHSVFSGLSLTFRDSDGSGGDAALRYSVQSSDPRLQFLKIGVEGPDAEGTLDAFFRPAPVQQPAYATIRTAIRADLFAGQRALVVGGSRGLGETTAKILAAGGAEVTVTYNRGQADARRVEADIRDGGGSCRISRLDVSAMTPQALAALAADARPTHVYFFASPKIETNRSDNWDAELFASYCRFYLDAFSALVNGLAKAASEAAGGLVFYCPSSVFVDAPRRGFSEYAVAKAASEALCRELQHRIENIVIVAPRLPRMKTDQTSGILPADSQPALPVMLDQLERLAQRDLH